MLTAASLATVLALPQGARAERVEPVDLAAGAVAISDSFSGNDAITYQFETERGRRMAVTLTATNPATHFNIYAPGTGPGEAPMFNGAREGSRYTGTLPFKGTYSVQVYLFRSAAQFGQKTEFTLNITPDGARSATTGYITGGPNGQPAFWKIDVEGALKIHATPSLSTPAELALPGGTIVHNRGCSEIDGIPWCQIEQPGGITGWAIATYLSPAPGNAIDAAAAVVPMRTRAADDIGTVACAASFDAPMTDCRYAVFRDGGGSGTLQVELPGGALRHIQFEQGKAVATDGGGEMNVTRQGDWLFIDIGGEHFAFPESKLAGG
jgi:hypothetical protein